MNGISELEGMVEICVDGSWRSVCDESWTELDASVTCMQLGFSPGGEQESEDERIYADSIMNLNYRGSAKNITGLWWAGSGSNTFQESSLQWN